MAEKVTGAWFEGPPCGVCGSTEKYTNGGCRPCILARGRAQYGTDEYREKDRERDKNPKRKAQRQAHDATPENRAAYSSYYYRWKYGISPKDQEELFWKQIGMCPICDFPLEPSKKMHLDHDHDTGKIRGFLCHYCNVAIGLARRHTWRSTVNETFGIAGVNVPRL